MERAVVLVLREDGATRQDQGHLWGLAKWDGGHWADDKSRERGRARKGGAPEGPGPQPRLSGASLGLELLVKLEKPCCPVDAWPLPRPARPNKCFVHRPSLAQKVGGGTTAVAAPERPGVWSPDPCKASSP